MTTTPAPKNCPGCWLISGEKRLEFVGGKPVFVTTGCCPECGREAQGGFQ